jgi:hypothetical protein
MRDRCYGRTTAADALPIVATQRNLRNGQHGSAGTIRARGHWRTASSGAAARAGLASFAGGLPNMAAAARFRS